MRVAIVSDIHGNRHAFEAVLDDDRGRPSARRCGAWATSSATAPSPTPACDLARAHAAICLAGNHDLARARRRSPLERVLARRRAGRAAGRRRCIDPETREYLRSLEPQNVEERGGPLPRQPARPGLGVRALAAAGRAVPRRPGRPRLPHRPLPRRAVVLRAPEGEPATGETRARRRGARPPAGRVADQPRQRRPAARRRPARRLAASSTPTAGRATWRRTEYDIAGAAAAIRAARLPDSLAERLLYGQ